MVTPVLKLFYLCLEFYFNHQLSNLSPAGTFISLCFLNSLPISDLLLPLSLPLICLLPKTVCSTMCFSTFFFPFTISWLHCFPWFQFYPQCRQLSNLEVQTSSNLQVHSYIYTWIFPWPFHFKIIYTNYFSSQIWASSCIFHLYLKKKY